MSKYKYEFIPPEEWVEKVTKTVMKLFNQTHIWKTSTEALDFQRRLKDGIREALTTRGTM